MYRYRYINNQIQFGQYNYELILDDLEDGLPTHRIYKTFKEEPDAEQLYQEAAKEILRVINTVPEEMDPDAKEKDRE